MNTPGLCPEARAWQSSLEYPAAALRRGVMSGSVTLDFVIRADGGTAEYRVETASNELFIGPSLEALTKLHCSGITLGQPLGQHIDYQTVD